MPHTYPPASATRKAGRSLKILGPKSKRDKGLAYCSQTMEIKDLQVLNQGHNPTWPCSRWVNVNVRFGVV